MPNRDTNKKKTRTPICRCPICRGKVFENSKAYYCENFKKADPCKFAVWKEVFGIEVTEDDIIDLTTRGVTFSKDVVLDDIPCVVMLSYDKNNNTVNLKKY